VTKNRDNLFRAETLEERLGEDLATARNLTARRIQGDNPAPSGSLASLLIEAADLADSTTLGEVDEYDIDEDRSGSETDDIPGLLIESPRMQIRLRSKAKYRIKYEDPWKIHAGRILGQMHGRNPRTILWAW
jgi:hypothetical protein